MRLSTKICSHMDISKAARLTAEKHCGFFMPMRSQIFLDGKPCKNHASLSAGGYPQPPGYEGDHCPEFFHFPLQFISRYSLILIFPFVYSTPRPGSIESQRYGYLKHSRLQNARRMDCRFLIAGVLRRTGGLGGDKPTSAAKSTWRRQGKRDAQPQSEP